MAARFAAAELAVKRRTNALVGPTGVQVPWPPALGTPPVLLPRGQFVDGGFVVAGWTVPWAVVVPR